MASYQKAWSVGSRCHLSRPTGGNRSPRTLRTWFLARAYMLPPGGCCRLWRQRRSTTRRSFTRSGFGTALAIRSIGSEADYLVRAPALRANELRKAHVLQGQDPKGLLAIWILSRLRCDIGLLANFSSFLAALDRGSLFITSRNAPSAEGVPGDRSSARSAPELAEPSMCFLRTLTADNMASLHFLLGSTPDPDGCDGLSGSPSLSNYDWRKQ